MSVQRRSDALTKHAERLGLSVNHHAAQTGTVYLTIDPPAGEAIVVRVADHSDAYGTSNYTADGMEGTDAGAKLFIDRWIAELRKDNEECNELLCEFEAEQLQLKAMAKELRALAKKHKANIGDWLLTEDGKQWYMVDWTLSCLKQGNMLSIQVQIDRLRERVAKDLIKADTEI